MSKSDPFSPLTGLSSSQTHLAPVQYSLKELCLYFLRLGTLGFGGPVALVGYMHRDLVEQRKWISEDEYKEGLTLAQLAPGPLAAQLAIYIGFLQNGFWGAVLIGAAFVLPSFVMVVLLGWLYRLYSGLHWLADVFYGVGAAVIGIIGLSAYKLTVKSVGKITVQSIRRNWLLWLFYAAGAVATIVTQREQVLLFIGCGLLYMAVKAPPSKAKFRLYLPVFLSAGTCFWCFSKDTLVQIAWFFLKAGTFVFGSGLAIVPFLHAGVVDEFHWLDETQFVDAVAVAMITPGPVVITVGFIGFLAAGFWGAVTAALSTFLPCFLFTVLPAPHFKKIARNSRVKAFVGGITAAVIGALMGSVVIIATRSVTDLYTALIALGAMILLLYTRRLQEPHIILCAAILGLLIRNIL